MARESFEQLVEGFARSRQILLRELSKAIVGQREVLDQVFAAMIAGGHCLLVGVPGLAKTMMVSSLARAMDLSYKRIQFTPDLMPSDITGTNVIDELDSGRREFRFVQGPIFAHIVLADEINRTPPKTQAAMLQAMQEREVTIGQQTHPLPNPFFVIATQNPIEQEGTYPLPEAQLDRFMLKVKVGYPTRDEELRIIDRMTGGEVPSASPVVDTDQLLRAREIAGQIYLDDRIKEYIVNLVIATRDPASAGAAELADLIEYGASPRASIFLVKAARAHAFLRRRGYVIPEDIKSVGLDILRHRVIPTFEAEAEELTSEDLVKRLFEMVEVP